MQGHRECANAINYLLGKSKVYDLLFEYLIKVSREDGILNGDASEAANGDIEAWEGGGVSHDDSLMTVNTVTGEFTAGVDGIYEMTVSMVYAGAGNNIQYGLGVRINGTAGAAFSYNVWTNSTTAQSFVGIGAALLAAGDVVNVTKVLGNEMTNINGSVRLTLIKPT